MIPRKLVEAAFRRWPLLLAPVLLAPALALYVAPSATEYVSGATVWVTDPIDLEAGVIARTDNPYTTPAEAQTQVLADLMATSSFREAIAVNAGIVAATDTAATRSSAAASVGEAIEVRALGESLVGIAARASSAEGALVLARSFLTSYDDWATTTLARESQLAVAYFTEQLTAAQAELDAREAALTAYLTLAPGAAVAFPPDARYQAMQGSVVAQRDIAQGLADSLQQAHLDVASAPQGLLASFNVQDEPELPLAPVAESLMARLAYPVMGLVFGIAIAGGYLFLVFRTDHTIRSSEDVEAAGTRLLAYVPALKPANEAAATMVQRLPAPRDFRSAFEDTGRQAPR